MRLRFTYQPLLLGGIGALMVAAVLVVYLQTRAASQQHRQTEAILQQVCERTATVVAARLRELFEGAVLEILEGIGHPEVKRYDMARVTAFLKAGTIKYPYVERFFFWSERSPAPYREQVMFFRPTADVSPQFPAPGPNASQETSFFAEPVLGGRLFQMSRAIGEKRRSFAVTEVVIDGRPYQVMIHFLWDDATRRQAFAIMGFLVNLEAVREHLFEEIAKTDLLNVLHPNPSSTKLALAVFDEQGERVYGSPVERGVPSAGAGIAMLFFPADALRQWLAEPPRAPRWRLVVWVAGPVEPKQQVHWLFAAVVGLLVIASFCAVTVNQNALHLSRMQADFVANVSHQLKTPLSLLAAAAETLGLERVRSPEKVSEYAEIVRSQTDRLSALVEQILHFSRLEASAGVYQLEVIDLAAFVRGTVESFARSLARTDVAVRFEGPGHPVMVRGDRNALEQVVTNLLANAIKYGTEGNEVSVEVALAERSAVLRVRDLGIGIDPADLPHVFEKFYRGRNNGHGRRGFGLGLAIVQTVVRGHGGSVSVTSDRARGTEFVVSLPKTA